MFFVIYDPTNKGLRYFLSVGGIEEWPSISEAQKAIECWKKSVTPRMAESATFSIEELR